MQMVCFRFLILHESNFAVWSLRRLLGLQLRKGSADGVKLGACGLVNVVLVVENVVHSVWLKITCAKIQIMCDKR